MKKKYYRSIFISDLHLGSSISQEIKLLEFLDNFKSDYLYICGDFIDFYHLYEHHGWSKNCNLVIRKLLSKVKKGTKIKICIGNHDAFLGIIAGYRFGNIEVNHEFIHKNKYIDYLVLHGDLFDKSLKMTKISQILSFLYTHFNWIPGFKTIKKHIIDNISARNISFKKLNNYVYKSNSEGVVFGHTHKPFINQNIINCGDWTENCTAVLEDFNGEFKLYKFKK